MKRIMMVIVHRSVAALFLVLAALTLINSESFAQQANPPEGQSNSGPAPTLIPAVPTVGGPFVVVTSTPTHTPAPGSTATATPTPTQTPTPVAECPSLLTDVDTDGNQLYYFQSTDAYCDTASEAQRNVRVHCFKNPYYTSSATSDVQKLKDRTVFLGTGSNHGIPGWRIFRDQVIASGSAAGNQSACYICGCFRGDHVNGGTGCFPPGVLIRMADGTDKVIEQVNAGDFVWNPVLKRPVRVARVIEGFEKLPILRFGYAGTEVRTSQQHPVLTVRGLVQAKELLLSDSVFDEQGAIHKLEFLADEPLEPGQRVINISLDVGTDDENFRMILANGVVTGDIVLQSRLVDATKKSQ